MPKISVLMPIYNTEPTVLKEAIESILNQTFTDFEFLILNDSPSNQDLKKIVESYRDDRIVYLENQENLGISGSRNKLMSFAKGEFIEIFDHDDISKSNRFELHMEFMKNRKDVDILGSNAHFMNADFNTNYPETNEEIKRKMMTECCMIHPSCVIRRSFLIKNNVSYDETFSPCEDYKMWIDLLDKAIFHNIKDPLIEYRDSMTNTSNSLNERFKDRTKMIRYLALQKFPQFEFKRTNIDIRLFSCIPFLKIKEKESHIYGKLFGFIPLFKIKVSN